jgi:hypothetical protein
MFVIAATLFLRVVGISSATFSPFAVVDSSFTTHLARRVIRQLTATFLVPVFVRLQVSLAANVGVLVVASVLAASVYLIGYFVCASVATEVGFAVVHFIPATSMSCSVIGRALAIPYVV